MALHFAAHDINPTHKFLRRIREIGNCRIREAFSVLRHRKQRKQGMTRNVGKMS